MTTSTIIVLVICCFLCPMGMFVTMNSKKNKKDSEDKLDTPVREDIDQYIVNG